MGHLGPGTQVPPPADGQGRGGRPTIGLTTRHVVTNGRQLDVTEAEYSLAIVRAGGLPRLLPMSGRWDSPDELAGIDGLLLTGGGDVDPARYGDDPSPATGGVDVERDASEFALLDLALGSGRPVFGICRGCQLINVGLGGSLVQDLTEVTSLAHLVPDRRNETVHAVTPVDDSLLSRLEGDREIQVNSIHHQAIRELGPGLRAMGYAPDGIIEAIELPGYPLLGVQWHPETLTSPTHTTLFDWLIGEARHWAGLETGPENTAPLPQVDRG
jgi:putative glutamine amidotransferase